ncbi:MAG: PIN domain-containing protein [Planctomycetes bacterium]|nr:PIN domain-containing protein [Planctomycetota bacterium]
MVFDASALLAWVRVEPGSLAVRSAIEASRRGQSELLLSLVTFGELLYKLERTVGLAAQFRFRATLGSLGIRHVQVTQELVVRAARWKVDGHLAYADAFVAATADLEGAEILTADPDFRKVEKRLPVRFIR